MTTSANYLSIPGLTAGVSLATSQYLAVQFSTTAGQVKLVTAATDQLAGLLQNDPAAGEAAEVAVIGVAKGKAAGTIYAGDHVTSNSTGLIATTTGNNHVLGVAVDGASANDIFRVALAPSNY